MNRKTISQLFYTKKLGRERLPKLMRERERKREREKEREREREKERVLQFRKVVVEKEKCCPKTSKHFSVNLSCGHIFFLFFLIF